MNDLPELNESDIVEEATPATPAVVEQTAEVKLSPEQNRQARAIAMRELNPADPNSITLFGAAVERQLAARADQLMQQVKVKDAGPVTGLLNNLLDETRGFNPRQVMQGKKGLFGRGKAKITEMVKQFESVSSRVDGFERDLKRHAETMRRDVNSLQSMIIANSQYYDNLQVYYVAGNLRLGSLRRQLEKKQQEFAQSGDIKISSEINSLNNFITRLEQRVHDLHILTQVAMQSEAQMRLIQQGDLTLQDKLQQTINTVLPLWKGQLVTAIAIYNQQQATSIQNKAADTTDRLLRENAEQLRIGSTNLARETQRSVVSIETLENTQTQLISTIEEVLSIQNEGRERRLEGERRINEMARALPEKLAQIQANQQSQYGSYNV